MFIPNYESNHSSQFFEKFLRRKISKNVCILIYDVFFPFFIINKLDKKKKPQYFFLVPENQRPSKTSHWFAPDEKKKRKEIFSLFNLISLFADK